jgi:hypothetical protein
MARDMSWKQPYEQSMALCRYIDGGGCDPNKVVEHWRRAFYCIAKYLGFNKATRRILWHDLAVGNWTHLHPTGDESRYTSDKWLDELRWDVHYCSDRWSLDRLMRCHWTYRWYVWTFCNEASMSKEEKYIPF